MYTVSGNSYLIQSRPVSYLHTPHFWVKCGGGEEREILVSFTEQIGEGIVSTH